MTAIEAQLTHPPTERADHRPVATLRRLVMADAAFTAVAGLALLGASEPLADAAGLATTGPGLVIGGSFVGLAVVVAILGRLPTHLLLRLTPVNAVGDLVWAGASAVVALAADLSGTGRAMVAGQGLAVLAIGEAKLLLARRARTTATTAP